MSNNKILVITPIHHIQGVKEILELIGDVTYLDDPTLNNVIDQAGSYDALYTNPNKSKVYIGKEVIDSGRNLKVICTASTGTNHIDKKYAAEKGVPILSLTEEREVINRISSTAELAFALTMAGLRHIVRSHNAVLQGEWDYTKYIGRQLNHLTVGVLGYGRLGSMYANYCKSFGAEVVVYDPYKTVTDNGLIQTHNIADLLARSNIISIHVHVTEETIGMIDSARLKQMKDDVLIVNTSRGDIINEIHLIEFLSKNKKARIATDVLADEIRNREASPLLQYAGGKDQIIITPHIGGMTTEAQEIAYGHAAKKLYAFLNNGCDEII